MMGLMLNKKGFSSILIILGSVFVLGLIAGAYYLGKGDTQRNINSTNVPGYSSQPSLANSSPSVPSSTPDATINWKTFNSESFSFKYPENLFIKETDPNFFVLLTQENDFPSNSDLIIDARQKDHFSNYYDAINWVKQGLSDVQVVNINSGVLISGKLVGPAYTGKVVSTALFKSGTGAISVESAGYLVNDDLFKQILATFKVTN